MSQQVLSEEELIKELRARSSNGVKYMYDTYAAILYKVIISKVKQPQLAEDLLESTFYYFLENIEDYHYPDGRVALWLMGIARRACSTALEKPVAEFDNQAEQDADDEIKVIPISNIPSGGLAF